MTEQPVMTLSVRRGLEYMEDSIQEHVSEIETDDSDYNDAVAAQAWIGAFIKWHRDLENNVPNGYLK